MDGCCWKRYGRSRIFVIVPVAIGIRVIIGLRETMRNLEYRKIGAHVQGGTVKGTAFEVKIKCRDDDDAVREGAIFKAKAVECNCFVVKAFIHNQFHAQTLLC